MPSDNELLCQIAITQIPGVGPVTARRLIAYCGGVEQVFGETYRALKSIPRVSEHIASTVHRFSLFGRAEQEMVFIRKEGIRPVFYLDTAYPFRLKQCVDAPLLLYAKGNLRLNCDRMVAVVGTRSITGYGRQQCERLMRDMAGLHVAVVSGLAYGVDACAHHEAVRSGIPAIAVLGHGLDRIYPLANTPLSESILGSGGCLVTEFMSGTRPERENFPKRNRIIAGLCDAIVVVEAAVTGGALITANIANTYNRDVFAVPGRINDTYSQGCNKLIRINKAHLLENVADIQYIMNWERGPEERTGQQGQLFVSLLPEEKTLALFLEKNPGASIDAIVAATGYRPGKATSLLLALEFKGVVKPMPGKTFHLAAKLPPG